MKKIYFIPFLFIPISIFSQEKLNLETCYSLLNKNYPLAKKSILLMKQNELDLAVISTNKFPKLELGAQTTYQSAVTQMPIEIPNTTVEAPNKDQYKATLSVNQLIYNGGLIDASKKVREATLKTQQKQVFTQFWEARRFQLSSYRFWHEESDFQIEIEQCWHLELNISEIRISKVYVQIRFSYVFLVVPIQIWSFLLTL